jgi:hypothetical protein
MDFNTAKSINVKYFAIFFDSNSNNGEESDNIGRGILSVFVKDVVVD